MKNLTSKNLPKISEVFTIVINLIPWNAWFERFSLRHWSFTSIQLDTTNTYIVCKSPNFQWDDAIFMCWKQAGELLPGCSHYLLLLQNINLTDWWNQLNNMEGVYYFKLIISDYHFEIILRNCHDVLVQTFHLKDECAFSFSLIFDHFLWIQWVQFWQKIELIPALLRQLLYGYFARYDLTDELYLLHTGFVLLTLNQSRFASILYCQSVSFSLKSFKVSAINTRLFVYNNFQGKPILNSMHRAFVTVMNG